MHPQGKKWAGDEKGKRRGSRGMWKCERGDCSKHNVEQKRSQRETSSRKRGGLFTQSLCCLLCY